jgi:hypothetical protein
MGYDSHCLDVHRVFDADVTIGQTAIILIRQIALLHPAIRHPQTSAYGLGNNPALQIQTRRKRDKLSELL